MNFNMCYMKQHKRRWQNPFPSDVSKSYRLWVASVWTSLGLGRWPVMQNLGSSFITMKSSKSVEWSLSTGPEDPLFTLALLPGSLGFHSWFASSLCAGGFSPWEAWGAHTNPRESEVRMFAAHGLPAPATAVSWLALENATPLLSPSPPASICSPGSSPVPAQHQSWPLPTVAGPQIFSILWGFPHSLLTLQG